MQPEIDYWKCGAPVELRKWYVEEDDDVWLVVHYVGGEDGWVAYDEYKSPTEAESVALGLNTKPDPETHQHYYPEAGL